jgi:hypothetical protein
MSCGICRVIVLPYSGVPRLVHQFPTAIVVVGVVVPAAVVVAVVLVVVLILVLVVVVRDVDDDVFVVQDASNIAVTSKKLKANQINLFFNFLLL